MGSQAVQKPCPRHGYHRCEVVEVVGDNVSCWIEIQPGRKVRTSLPVEVFGAAAPDVKTFWHVPLGGSDNAVAIPYTGPAPWPLYDEVVHLREIDRDAVRTSVQRQGLCRTIVNAVKARFFG